MKHFTKDVGIEFLCNLDRLGRSCHFLLEPCSAEPQAHRDVTWGHGVARRMGRKERMGEYINQNQEGGLLLLLTASGMRLRGRYCDGDARVTIVTDAR